MYTADEANKLLERTHTGVTAEFASIANTTASVLLQLRSHERALENHDDVVLVIKDIVLQAVCNAHDGIADLAAKVPDFNNNANTDKFIADATGLDYHARLLRVSDGYAAAFPNAAMARALLLALPELIATHIDAAVMKLAVFMRVCDDAMQRKLLANPRQQLIAQLVAGVRKACETTTDDVESMMEYACPELDKLALAEHAVFVKAVEAGAGTDAALKEANSSIRAQVGALLKTIEDSRKGDSQ